MADRGVRQMSNSEDFDKQMLALRGAQNFNHCPDCYGKGSLSTPVVVYHDAGPPRRTVSITPCKGCGGSGTLGDYARHSLTRLLDEFSEKANQQHSLEEEMSVLRRKIEMATLAAMENKP